MFVFWQNVLVLQLKEKVYSLRTCFTWDIEKRFIWKCNMEVRQNIC